MFFIHQNSSIVWFSFVLQKNGVSTVAVCLCICSREFVEPYASQHCVLWNQMLVTTVFLWKQVSFTSVFCVQHSCVALTWTRWSDAVGTSIIPGPLTTMRENARRWVNFQKTYEVRGIVGNSGRKPLPQVRVPDVFDIEFSSTGEGWGLCGAAQQLRQCGAVHWLLHR